MTQITVPAVATEVTYAATSSTTGPFTIPFMFFQEGDIKATVTDALDVEDELVVTTDFTFDSKDTPVGQEGNGYEGGVISLNVAIGADGDSSIRIYRDTIIDRTANYPNTGPFSMPLLNDEQNKHIAIMQEIERNIISTAEDLIGVEAQDLQDVCTIDNTTSVDIELVAADLVLDIDSLITFKDLGDDVMCSLGWEDSGDFLAFRRVEAGAKNVLLQFTGCVIRSEENNNSVLTIGESLVDRGDSQRGILNIYGENTGVHELMQLFNDGTVGWINIGNMKGQLDTHPDEVFELNTRSISLAETASAAADEATYGQIWVKDDAPNVPYFTDDTGVDQIIDPSNTPINNQSASYELLLSDKGKTIRYTGGTVSQAYTIPAESAVDFPIGTLIGVDNDGTVDITIVITDDELRFAKDNTTGTRTLAAGASAVIKKVASAKWKIAGSVLVT